MLPENYIPSSFIQPTLALLLLNFMPRFLPKAGAI